MKTTLYLIIASFLLINSCNTSKSDCEKEREVQEANKKMVAEFYQALFGDKNIEVIDKYIAEDYIQHNPMAADGREALKNALKGWFENASKEQIDIRRIGADGDLVFLHTKNNFGGKTFSVIDIFRIENGIIAEHWDVIQQVPDSAANEHPMF